MNDHLARELRILVERAVRPVRASSRFTRTIREELLAHVSAVFEEEVARDADERAALGRTARRFGDPAELTQQLRGSVPKLDPVERFFERIADWVFFQPDESTLRRAVRYVALFEAVPLLLLALVLPLLWAELGEWPIGALQPAWPALLVIGCLGVTVCLLEASIRRLLGRRTRGAWLAFGLVFAGSGVISMALGAWAFGITPNKAAWLFCYLVGLPALLAWALARYFVGRKRYHDDWSGLQID